MRGTMIPKTHDACSQAGVRGLFSQAKGADDGQVALAILTGQEFQQRGASADHLQQPATRGVVFGMQFQVVGELPDALSEQGDLNFRRAGVTRMSSELLDDF